MKSEGAPVVPADPVQRLELQRAGIREHLAQALAGRPVTTEGVRVLEVGCGTGLLTEALVEQLPGAIITALDHNRDALEVAQARLGDRARFVHAEAREALRGGERFDVVASRLFLMHQPDPMGMLRAMRRSLRPNGSILAFEFDLGTAVWYPSSPALERVIGAAKSAACLAAARASWAPDALLGRRLYSAAMQAGFAHPKICAFARCVTAAECASVRDETENMLGILGLVGGYVARTKLISEEDVEAAMSAVRRWPDEPAFFTCQTHFALTADS